MLKLLKAMQNHLHCTSKIAKWAEDHKEFVVDQAVFQQRVKSLLLSVLHSKYLVHQPGGETSQFTAWDSDQLWMASQKYLEEVTLCMCAFSQNADDVSGTGDKHTCESNSHFTYPVQAQSLSPCYSNNLQFFSTKPRRHSSATCQCPASIKPSCSKKHNTSNSSPCCNSYCISKNWEEDTSPHSKEGSQGKKLLINWILSLQWMILPRKPQRRRATHLNLSR